MTNEELAYAREVMTIHADRILYTRTEFGRGETDYVRVYVTPEVDEIVDVSYYIALVAGLRMTERGIAVRGVGVNKGLEVVDSLSRAMNGKAPNQKLWREIH